MNEQLSQGREARGARPDLGLCAWWALPNARGPLNEVRRPQALTRQDSLGSEN